MSKHPYKYILMEVHDYLFYLCALFLFSELGISCLAIKLPLIQSRRHLGRPIETIQAQSTKEPWTSIQNRRRCSHFYITDRVHMQATFFPFFYNVLFLLILQLQQKAINFGTLYNCFIQLSVKNNQLNSNYKLSTK